MQQLALTLWIAGLSLLLQVNGCSSDLCNQARIAGNTAISFSQNILNTPISSTTPTTPTTPPDIINSTSVGVPVVPIAPIAPPIENTITPVIPVIPTTYTLTYSVLSHTPFKRADANDDGIEDIGGAIIKNAETAFNMHIEFNQSASGHIDIYSGGLRIAYLTHNFNAVNTVDYQVTNIWGAQMSYVLMIDGLPPTARTNLSY